MKTIKILSVRLIGRTALLMKNVALCALLVMTSISCTRPKNENKMVYSVAYPDTITITQYEDTTVLLPISLYYSSGQKKAISISPIELPDWVKYDTSLLEVMPDVLTGIKYRFHPAEAGIYSLSFQLSETSSEPKMHQFVVKVNEGNNCTNYLKGNYRFVNTNSVLGYSYPQISVTDVWRQNARIDGKICIIDCDNRSIEIRKQKIDNINYQATGTYNRDSIFLHLITHQYQP